MLRQEDLPLDSRTLDPLPPVLRHGLAAVSFFGFLSFLASTTLFAYLTYKLINWRIRGQARDGYNQFVLLIYMLLLADIQQSLAFLLPTRWLAENKINVGTSTCWAEGWFVSTGDLASGVWIFTIAIHTFLALVLGYKLRYRTFCTVLIGLWVFIYAMAIIGTAAHPNDFYTRAGAVSAVLSPTFGASSFSISHNVLTPSICQWCWINSKYTNERLWLHYFWIFICMFGTITIYGITYITLRHRLNTPHRSTPSRPNTNRSVVMDPASTNRAARYMILYPTIYVICTLPLAAGRMAAMTGRDIPDAYYCLAGALITSCGWLDVLLYTLTRRVLIFSNTPPAIDDFGMETFCKTWGTSTRIEGGIHNNKNNNDGGRDSQSRDGIGRQISSRAGSTEDFFGEPAPGGRVATKTTVEVRSQRIFPASDEDISMQDMERGRAVYRPGSKEDLGVWGDDHNGRGMR